MACVNQKRKNNIGSGGASSMSNFFVKNKKKIMTRKKRWETKLFQLIWLQLNIQFVEKLSLKVKVIDWHIMIFTQKIWKKSIHYSINYKQICIYQGIAMCLKDHIRQISADMVALHKSVYILENWVKKCSIYQTTNILKGGIQSTPNYRRRNYSISSCWKISF